jgi:tetraacyldisaccharide 4'-kinase
MRLFRKIIFYCEQKIQNNEDRVFLKILYFFSLFWKAASFSKNFLYDRKIFHSKKVSGKVISIGNITAGGTGKTPFILEITQRFLDLIQKTESDYAMLRKDRPTIAILSRGYQSKVEHQKIPFLVETHSKISWKKIGDEPEMIVRRFFSYIEKKELFLFVGKNRKISAEIAAKISCKIILLDDGFSYRKLFRDEEIVLINGKEPLGKNFFLPRGFLRESPKNLKRASIVVIHQVFTEEEFMKVKEDLQPFTEASFVGMRPFVKKVVFQDEKERKVEKAALFSAIGSPKLFYDEMKNSMEIVDQLTQLDHEPFLMEDLQNFAIKAKNLGAEVLLCTEKDFVKLSFETSYALPIGYIEMGLDIFIGKEHIEKLLKRTLWS